VVISGENDDTMPLRDSLRDLVMGLHPAAERLGCVEELQRVLDVIEDGASYQRQRAVAAASGGDLVAVVDSLLEEFATGKRTTLPKLEPATAIGEPGAAGAVS
jgi:carboxylate-amine ligase